MASYNRVNGTHASEDPHLLREVLRKQLGFDGMLMSDWGGTYSAAEAVKASLDLDMPGPTTMRGPCLERAVVSGKLTHADMDECVLRVSLWLGRAASELMNRFFNLFKGPSCLEFPLKLQRNLSIPQLPALFYVKRQQ